MGAIRPISICVFRHAGRILVFRSKAPGTGADFFRPFGGGIEFGESAAEAVVREIQEELGESIGPPKFLGVLENRFEYAGQLQHEHVFVFDADFTNRYIYELVAVEGTEANGEPLHGEWVDPTLSGEGIPLLYPDGLQELLKSSGRLPC